MREEEKKNTNANESQQEKEKWEKRGKKDNTGIETSWPTSRRAQKKRQAAKPRATSREE